MDWDNLTVLKFIELYQINECIWNPHHESHKNRQRVNDAWSDIKDNLGVACTVKDLKKKKESLMASYRQYKSKIRKSEKSGFIYQPSWFAFSVIDVFLGPIYTPNPTSSTEDEETFEVIDTTIITDEFNESNPTTTNQELSFMTPTPKVRRKQKNPLELIEPKQHIKEAFNVIEQIAKEQHQPKSVDDECTIFGQLIAMKMRKLSEERRDIMMVKINQLFVDEHMLNSH